MFYLQEKVDFKRHNEEVRKLMADFKENKAARAPVIVAGSIRNLLSNPEVNHTGFTFKDFFTKAEAQLKCQLEYQNYARHNILCDNEMGVPEKNWTLTVDLQNSYDQGWFGCPLLYFGDLDVPDTEEILKKNPEAFYDWGDPDPFWGRGDMMKKSMEIYEELKKICDSGYEFYGRPVSPPVNFRQIGTDGVFSVALKLRGTVELMCDMYENPKYYHDLMDYVTRNTIRRMKSHREWMWNHDPELKGERKFKGPFGMADDSIAMLSREQYKELVYPYHKMIFDEFHDGSGSLIHLCGDATHHFKFLADSFNVKSFDTGFPVNHGKLRRELGSDITINGGPTIMLVKDGTPSLIDDAVRKICESGVLEGGRFVLIAANNLAPCTPVENIKALYDAGKKYALFYS
ncbi:MAG: hypothetical protein A2020_03665 [Lentisphaerae bacterium GWF2_45_14]|nr:MAG: hypothetical protein A2020_03665 [Lentisphaerae bacterium GWF2_45_14]